MRLREDEQYLMRAIEAGMQVGENLPLLDLKPRPVSQTTPTTQVRKEINRRKGAYREVNGESWISARQTTAGRRTRLPSLPPTAAQRTCAVQKAAHRLSPRSSCRRFSAEASRSRRKPERRCISRGVPPVASKRRPSPQPIGRGMTYKNLAEK